MGVSCASATFCIAVGDATGSAGQVPLAVAWDGTSWTIQQIPSPAGGGVLDGVSCTSASACVAVGNYFGSAQMHGHCWSHGFEQQAGRSRSTTAGSQLPRSLTRSRS
jgi:hypothetical protein